jgi:CheY-like chemotaxis protein
MAENGRQALEMLQTQPFDLVLLDLLMPEMDGYALCRKIKSDKRLKDTPVVLVTLLSEVRDVIKGLECGADHFIRKPYDEKYLLSRLEHILLNREVRRDQKMQIGVEIYLGGRTHLITCERQQILNLLISAYEEAIHINEQLMAVNKELEAFRYSVSHDLRAQLRHIDGFSQALLEEYAHRLDQKGTDYLRRVRTATQRMAELIDDLLR